MSGRFIRTEMIFGGSAMERLAECRVAVFGIGGVGGYTVEALARSGVGALDLIDSDTVCMSNINRQIIATESTVGRYKTDVAKSRILDINPHADVTAHKLFLTPENADLFDFAGYDYVVDATDTVQAKITLAVRCSEAGTALISSMGAGNKVDPTRFEVADIYSTSVDPLARVMRRELKKRGVGHLKVVYSKEEPIAPFVVQSGDEISAAADGEHIRRRSPGSNAFVPAVAGLIIAGEVIKDLTGFGKA